MVAMKGKTEYELAREDRMRQNKIMLQVQNLQSQSWQLLCICLAQTMSIVQVSESLSNVHQDNLYTLSFLFTRNPSHSVPSQSLHPLVYNTHLIFSQYITLFAYRCTLVANLLTDAVHQPGVDSDHSFPFLSVHRSRR